MTATVLATLLMLGAAPDALEPAREEMLNDLVLRAAAADERVEAIAWEQPPPVPACLADAACLSRLADDAQARLVLFGEVGVKKGLLWFTLDAFDVRTGRFAGREVAQTATGQDLNAHVAAMTRTVLDRVFEGRSARRGKIPLVVLRLVPPERASGQGSTLDVPWLLFGSAIVGAAGVIGLGSAGVLYALAWERDLRAGQAVWQIEAWQLVQERNIYALTAAMTGMLAGSLFIFAAMGVTYWVLVDE